MEIAFVVVCAAASLYFAINMYAQAAARYGPFLSDVLRTYLSPKAIAIGAAVLLAGIVSAAPAIIGVHLSIANDDLLYVFVGAACSMLFIAWCR